jgi:prepilin-type N-terminal cleavage/methylation domain-containing protein
METAMSTQSPIPNPQSEIARGFTLIELLAVMVIITIILGLILNAAMDTVRRSEERATQSLITKLEAGLSDRLDALLQTRPDSNFPHGYIAAVFTPSSATSASGVIPPLLVLDPNTGMPVINPQTNRPIPNVGVTETQRAQVIAWYDYIKAELPDVFFVQNTTGPYPLNFTGRAYPGNPTDPNRLGNYILPLGTSVAGPFPGGYGDGNTSNPALGFAGSGIYGASYAAAAGIYKNLGYLPTGYDGVDNNNNGLIDEWAEGVDSTNQALVQRRLGNHTHITARSEMLYALLVEGRGPLGSVFNKDDFTDKEVRDTDNDGLPEFVDAWGQPLQFFRWPLLYHSDIQRGQVIVNASNLNQYQVVNSTYSVGSLVPPYLTPFEQREQNSLDLNQQLLAPAWWSTTSTGGGQVANASSPFASALNAPPPVPAGVSGGVQAFAYFFHRLAEPIQQAGPSPNFWDRGTKYPERRAFYSKFLILSSGPDQLPGVFLFPDYTLNGRPPDVVCSALLLNENNAMQFSVVDVADFRVRPYVVLSAIPASGAVDPINNPPNSYDIQQAGQDDISNQNLQTIGGIGGS